MLRWSLKRQVNKKHKYNSLTEGSNRSAWYVISTLTCHRLECSSIPGLVRDKQAALRQFLFVCLPQELFSWPYLQGGLRQSPANPAFPRQLRNFWGNHHQKRADKQEQNLDNSVHTANEGAMIPDRKWSNKRASIKSIIRRDLWSHTAEDISFFFF